MAQKRLAKSDLNKKSMQDYLKIYGLGFAIIALTFFTTFQFVEPSPPSELRIASGRADGAYYAFAQRYAKQLKQENITLHIVETTGSVENETLLNEGKVDVAFMQSGIGSSERTPHLMALGSLYYEPLWIFARTETANLKLTDLINKRIAIGGEGSGTRAIVEQLLVDNQLDSNTVQRDDRSGMEAANALLTGEVDAVFMVSSIESPVIQRLLDDANTHLMSLTRAEAYTLHHRYLSKLTLPEGVLDFQRNLPPQPVELLAPAATLVANENLHPALSDLLMQTISQIHGEAGMFSQAGAFPSPQYTDFPLSDEAQRFYKHGAPFLQRYMPFWAATLIDRLKVMILPLFALMIPLMKILPPTYRWRIRSRIYRWYDELQLIDMEVHANPTPEKINHGLQQLSEMEEELRQIEVPLSYAQELYSLREHLFLLQKQLRALA